MLERVASPWSLGNTVLPTAPTRCKSMHTFAHPCTCICMHLHVHIFTCAQTYAHLHMYIPRCDVAFTKGYLCLSFPSFYRPLGLFLSICIDILEEGNLECLVVGQKGEQLSRVSPRSTYVCAHLWTCIQRGLFACVCTYLYTCVHSYLPGRCLASAVLECLCLCASVSLGIFSSCLAIPTM